MKNVEAKSSWILSSSIFVIPILAFVAFAGVVAFVFKLGYFAPVSGSAPQATVVAAAIALLGGLVGSLVTFIGLIQKHVADQHNLDLQKQAESRAASEQSWRVNSEKLEFQRLNVEAALKGVALLSTNDGKDVTTTQYTGVVLALGNLGLWPLSLSLCEVLLREGKLDIGTACWLLDNALKSTDSNVQQQAAIITNDFTELMIRENGRAYFPAVFLDKKVFTLDQDAFQTGVFSLIDLVLCQSYSCWDKNVLVRVLDSLRNIYRRKSTSKFIKENIGVSLNRFTKGFMPDEMISWSTGVKSARESWQEFTNYEGGSLDGHLTNGVSRESRALEWVDHINSKETYDGSQGMMNELSKIDDV